MCFHYILTKRFICIYDVEIERERSDVWYNDISEFLESQVEEEDTIAPWSLTIALCRVLADAAEQIKTTEEKKLEYVIRMAAYSMGFDGIIVFIAKEAKSDTIV